MRLQQGRRAEVDLSTTVADGLTLGEYRLDGSVLQGERNRPSRLSTTQNTSEAAAPFGFATIQPFTAPLIKPSITHFCVSTNRITTGNTVKTASAMIAW
jgi:hypothetical protein